jgi:hypothetical protein
MADVKNVMGVDAGDIKNIMGVEAGDIKNVMGVDLSTAPAYTGLRFICFGSGTTASADWGNAIDYKASTSNGNASDFGDMSEAMNHGSAAGSQGGRAVHGGGAISPSYTAVRNNIEYVTIASTGNTTDAGDLSVARSEGPSCGGNGTTAIWAGGYIQYEYVNTMDYMAISSTGGASDFGDLNNSAGLGNGSGSLTRFLHSGGTSLLDVIDYVAFDTTGNASDFGNLVAGVRSNAGGIATEARIINSAGGTIT